ncbi:hypothetical protein EC968_000858 [Mortierella alpina]|nr:hypothetical protein EC968_000858 [Mortierella alpina]
MSKTERHETKTNFDIAAAKTSRILQSASLNETSRAAGLLEGGSNDQDELECSVRSNRKKQDGSFKENKKQAMAIDESSSSRETDDGVATVSSSYETTASFHGVAGGSGAAFRRLQEEAAPFINDESLNVSIKKLYLML